MEDKKIKTNFRIPFLNTQNEDSWGRYLWMRFFLQMAEWMLWKSEIIL
jgi:hypothetical protein